MIRDVPLILRALRMHRVICVLIVVQVALACVILGNGLNLVGQRYVLQSLSTGLAEESLLVLDVEVLQGRLDKVQRDEVVAAVKALPDVSSAAYVNSLPFTGHGSAFKFARRDKYERQMDGALYYGSSGFMDTLGIRVVAGRSFASDDFLDGDLDPFAHADKLILSESLSRRLAAPVGSQVEIAGRALTVIGISEDVMGPMLVDPEYANNTAFIPSPPGGVESSLIVVNVRPGASTEMMAEVVSAATRVTPETHVWSVRKFEELRASYFILDRTIIRLIFGLGILLALVVAGGIFGLSNYWIIRRYKQIAIRRALGARRRDIAWYFHMENFFLTFTGGMLGFVGAIALSIMLTKWMGLPSMPIWPISWGAFAMMIVGQLAVFVPVRRAVAVPPGALRTP